jgi:hypothetical protein
MRIKKIEYVLILIRCLRFINYIGDGWLKPIDMRIMEDNSHKSLPGYSAGVDANGALDLVPEIARCFGLQNKCIPSLGKCIKLLRCYLRIY